MTTPQQSHQAPPSADDFLFGGGGAPSASFLTVGTTVSGRITERPTVQQQRDMKTGENKFWPDGNPAMQLVVTVQTDSRDPQLEEDDGQRRIFIKNQMKAAVADAVRAAGGRGLEVGGTLSITFTHELPPKQRGFNPLKQYSATYIPAATAALHAPDPGMQPSVPAPQQYAPPVQQQYAPAPAQAAPAPQYANPAVAALQAQQQAQAAAAPPPF
ncbi:hypothetical protein [Streptomyces racemochromogenes]|uniref:hypothetical protein n=1 Tax=Streptomyces racemochromogenes TaxID=67353 RepID=UPI0031E81698